MTDSDLWLNIAGWRICVRCRPEAVAAAASLRYADFALRDAESPAMLVVFEARPAAVSGETRRELLDLPVRGSGREWALDGTQICGRISLSLRHASLTVTSASPSVDLEYFLRLVCALLAFDQGGLLVHSSAVMADGKVHQFVGQSGSGKSTVVAFSQPGAALGDDLIVLRRSGSGWCAYGTPFWNATTQDRAGQTAFGRLVGIYKLVQAPRVALEPMSRAAAAAELAANSPVLNGIPDLFPDLLERCRAVVETVPMQRLHFLRDGTFWRLLAPGGGMY